MSAENKRAVALVLVVIVLLVFNRYENIIAAIILDMAGYLNSRQ